MPGTLGFWTTVSVATSSSSKRKQDAGPRRSPATRTSGNSSSPSASGGSPTSAESRWPPTGSRSCRRCPGASSDPIPPITRRGTGSSTKEPRRRCCKDRKDGCRWASAKRELRGYPLTSAGHRHSDPPFHHPGFRRSLLRIECAYLASANDRACPKEYGHDVRIHHP